MIKKYKHVIWDWNGTMLDDVELCVEVGNNLFRRKSIPEITVQKYKEIFTIPVEDYYKAVGFTFDEETFEVVGKEWMDEYEERKYECSLHTGLVEVLHDIYEAGIKQSVLSAYKQNKLEEMINGFGLDKYLDNIVGLDNIYAESKLHLGKELIKKLGNGHGETLLIGDTVHDYDVAKEMGSDCILISSGHQTKEKLTQTGTPVFENLPEFKNTFIKNGNYKFL